MTILRFRLVRQRMGGYWQARLGLGRMAGCWRATLATIEELQVASGRLGRTAAWRQARLACLGCMAASGRLRFLAAASGWRPASRRLPHGRNPSLFRAHGRLKLYDLQLKLSQSALLQLIIFRELCQMFRELCQFATLFFRELFFRCRLPLRPTCISSSIVLPSLLLLPLGVPQSAGVLRGGLLLMACSQGAEASSALRRPPGLRPRLPMR